MFKIKYKKKGGRNFCLLTNEARPREESDNGLFNKLDPMFSNNVFLFVGLTTVLLR